MTLMPVSDQYCEEFYDTVNDQGGEKDRAEVARIGVLAAKYRAQQLQRKRMAKAIAGRKRGNSGVRLHDADCDTGAPLETDGAPD